MSEQIDYLEQAIGHLELSNEVPGGYQTEALEVVALAQAEAAIDAAKTLRAILAELQAQRLEPCVEPAPEAEE